MTTGSLRNAGRPAPPHRLSSSSSLEWFLSSHLKDHTEFLKMFYYNKMLKQSKREEDGGHRRLPEGQGSGAA